MNAHPRPKLSVISLGNSRSCEHNTDENNGKLLHTSALLLLQIRQYLYLALVTRLYMKIVDARAQTLWFVVHVMSTRRKLPSMQNSNLVPQKVYNSYPHQSLFGRRNKYIGVLIKGIRIVLYNQSFQAILNLIHSDNTWDEANPGRAPKTTLKPIAGRAEIVVGIQKFQTATLTICKLRPGLAP